MSDTARGKVRASRASAPKRRTGCGTCKIRHKRCDEAKPICQNCSKTGRVCDGYIDSVTGQQYGGHPTRTSRSVSPLPNFFSPGLFKDPQEAQGFRFFIDGTDLQLGVSMGNNNWSTPLLQLAQQNSAIRLAAISVGIMSKRFEANELSVTADVHANDLSSLALTQYSKAISQLRLLLDTSPGDKSVLPHSVLACCILLMLFEFLQGNADGVQLHLGNAVKLTGPAHTSALGKHLLFLLASLDMASVLWLNLDRAHTDAPLPFTQLQTCAVPLQPYINLETLCYELAGIQNDIMTFSHNAVRAQQQTSGSVRENLLQIKRSIQSRLDLWYHSFSNIRPTVNDVLESRHFLLRANYLFLTLKLDVINVHDRSSAVAARMQVPHESRDLKLTQFSEILDLTEAALETKYPSTRYDAFTGEKALEPTGLLPLFSFRTGFISPVFFVAQNAPDTNLRWRAVRILSERPWREGAWDSAAMAAIAERSLGA